MKLPVELEESLVLFDELLDSYTADTLLEKFENTEKRGITITSIKPIESISIEINCLVEDEIILNIIDCTNYDFPKGPTDVQIGLNEEFVITDLEDIKDLPNKQNYGWYRKFDKKRF